MNAFWTVFASLALLCACTSTRTQDAESGSAFRNLARGYQTGVTGTGVRIARTETEWRELWKQHASTVIPTPAVPVVDFKRDMVVCVSLGSRPTYGYAVEIVRIAPVDAKHFRVEVTEKKPAPDAITSQIVTQPYHMIVTAKRAGTAELITR